MQGWFYDKRQTRCSGNNECKQEKEWLFVICFFCHLIWVNSFQFWFSSLWWLTTKSAACPQHCFVGFKCCFLGTPLKVSRINIWPHIVQLKSYSSPTYPFLGREKSDEQKPLWQCARTRTHRQTTSWSLKDRVEIQLLKARSPQEDQWCTKSQ